MPSPPDHTRILIVDDNPAIHDDFTKILAAPAAPDHALDALESALFDDAPSAASAAARDAAAFDLAHAMQGRDALALAVAARDAGRPFATAFVDMRMPPGWDGLETIEQLWRADPDLQIVVCSAYSDYTWNEIRARLGDRDGLLVIKKPFDAIEVVQCAHALAAKWRLARRVRAHVDELETAVAARTSELRAEMRERERVESELRLAQKLEAIGQLAAGIAHEIMTPLQYIGSNASFVTDSLQPLLESVTGDLRGELPEALAAINQGVSANRGDRARDARPRAPGHARGGAGRRQPRAAVGARGRGAADEAHRRTSTSSSATCRRSCATAATSRRCS